MVHTHRKNTEKLKKGHFWTSIRHYQLHWFLGPCSTENSRAKRLETGTERGVQGPIKPWLLYRAAISIKQARAAHFSQIGLSQETDS